jgi:hypothetical protein
MNARAAKPTRMRTPRLARAMASAACYDRTHFVCHVACRPIIVPPMQSPALVADNRKWMPTATDCNIATPESNTASRRCKTTRQRCNTTSLRCNTTSLPSRIASPGCNATTRESNTTWRDCDIAILDSNTTTQRCNTTSERCRIAFPACNSTMQESKTAFQRCNATRGQIRPDPAKASVARAGRRFQTAEWLTHWLVRDTGKLQHRVA